MPLAAPDRMPANTATALSMAVQAARAASQAAAHTAATLLAEATGTSGTIHRTWRGEGPDAWCKVTASGLRADILRSSHGDRAHCELTAITPEGYERIRAWAQDLNECPHDGMCDCVESPWPTLAELLEDGGELEIVYRDDDERGLAKAAFNRICLTFFDEPVANLAHMIALSRSA
ncbi:hypothetical protein AB0H73_35100 [Streptomyces olivoreticuli]